MSPDVFLCQKVQKIFVALILFNATDLSKAENAKVEEVHTKVLKVAEMLAEEDAEALLQAKLEDKQLLIALLLEQYTDMSTQQKLKTLDQYLSEELPKLLELQDAAKK